MLGRTPATDDHQAVWAVATTRARLRSRSRYRRCSPARARFALFRVSVGDGNEHERKLHDETTCLACGGFVPFLTAGVLESFWRSVSDARVAKLGP